MTQNENPNRHQNQTTNQESCLDRTAMAILMHDKDYPLDYIAKYFFPAETPEPQIRKALICDNRFTLHETEEGITVDRTTTSITTAERETLVAVEDWKNQMSDDFQQHTNDIKLCMLSQNIKRPKGVPKNVKLIDILNTDLQRRFLLLPSPLFNKKGCEDMMVKYKCTPTEVERYHEDWRNDVALYLLQQKCPIPLVTIGTHVAKPKNLGKNQKLIDVVKMDKQGRFDTRVDESHNSLTRLSVTKEYCLQSWRNDIYNLWKSYGCGALLNSASIRRAHPPAALGYLTRRHRSMWEMIVTDPQERFKNAIDYHVVLEKVKFDHQRQHQLQHKHKHKHPPAPTASLVPTSVPPAPHPSNLHAPVDSWAGARKASPRSERLQDYPAGHKSHPQSNYQRIPQQEPYQYQLPPPYHGYPKSRYSHYVAPTQAHTREGYGRTHRTTRSPQNNSTVMSAACPPPGFGQLLGAPQARSAVSPAVASVQSVVSAASAAAAKVSRQLWCYDKNISPASIKSSPVTFSQHNTDNDTDFNEFADPSPAMPGILNHIALDSQASKSADSATPQSICTAMSSYIPNLSSLDELVASHFKGQDTAPGLLRFLSDTF